MGKHKTGCNTPDFGRKVIIKAGFILSPWGAHTDLSEELRAEKGDSMFVKYNQKINCFGQTECQFGCANSHFDADNYFSLCLLDNFSHEVQTLRKPYPGTTHMSVLTSALGPINFHYRMQFQMMSDAIRI